MRLPASARKQVRERARFVCEYCGVSEEDTAGELTVDHYQPRSRAGTDSLDNLLYCCHQCNARKADYWPQSPSEIPLWNPRLEPLSEHFLLLASGHLYPLTPTAEFTIDRLALNRPLLVAYRLARLQIRGPERAAEEYHELISVLGLMKEELAEVLREYRETLREYRRWLERLRG